MYVVYIGTTCSSFNKHRAVNCFSQILFFFSEKKLFMAEESFLSMSAFCYQTAFEKYLKVPYWSVM